MIGPWPKGWLGPGWPGRAGPGRCGLGSDSRISRLQLSDSHHRRSPKRDQRGQEWTTRVTWSDSGPTLVAAATASSDWPTGRSPRSTTRAHRMSRTLEPRSRASAPTAGSLPAATTTAASPSMAISSRTASSRPTTCQGSWGCLRALVAAVQVPGATGLLIPGQRSGRSGGRSAQAGRGQLPPARRAGSLHRASAWRRSADCLHACSSSPRRWRLALASDAKLRLQAEPRDQHQSNTRITIPARDQFWEAGAY